MPDAHYPINFVVKHPNLLTQKARPWAVGNLPTRPEGLVSLFPNRSFIKAAIRKQLSYYK